MGDYGNQDLTRRVELLEVEVEEQGQSLRYKMQRLERMLAAQAQREAGVSLSAGKNGVPELAGEAVNSAPLLTPFPHRREDKQKHSPDIQETGGKDGEARAYRLPFDLDRLREGEWWLNKIGIGLLLLGVVFLFKFSMDQGWITPPIRVGVGLGVAALLLVLGLRSYPERRSFGQVLLGGGVGTLYITGYAAFQLYGLVPYAAALVFMVAVTSLAFVFAVRQNGAVLALIGTLGGLGTPFLLGDDSGGIGRLVLYTSLILVGSCAVYLVKGWRSLLLVSFCGTWMVLLIGYVGAFEWRVDIPLSDRLAMQFGVTAAWILPVLTAVAREVLRARAPERWSFPVSAALRESVGEKLAQSAAPAQFVCAAAALLFLTFTSATWALSESQLGWISLGIAAVYALAALLLHRSEGAAATHYTQGLTSLMLATLALFLLLDGNALYMALVIEATALHFFARRYPDTIVRIGAHTLFAGVYVWMWIGFSPAPYYDGPFITNLYAVEDLICISLVFAASFTLADRRSLIVYRIAAHVALLAWLWRELSMLPNGDAYVTISWGVYAATLLVAGLRLDGAALRRAGMVTLFLVVGKLFLVDLAGVEAGWRILLFLGFGGLFLSLSYSLHKLWRPKTGSSVTARYPEMNEPR